jgi:chromosome segregation ATPase
LSENKDSVFEALKFMLKVAANVVAVLGEGYIELINRSLSKAGRPIIRVRSSRRGVHVSLDDGPEQVDERIAKIEVARQSLTDALAAMDELKERAEDNKRDLEFLTLQIELAEADKANLSGELKTLKEMAALDSEAVRKVLRADPRRLDSGALG